MCRGKRRIITRAMLWTSAIMTCARSRGGSVGRTGELEVSMRAILREFDSPLRNTRSIGTLLDSCEDLEGLGGVAGYSTPLYEASSRRSSRSLGGYWLPPRRRAEPPSNDLALGDWTGLSKAARLDT